VWLTKRFSDQIAITFITAKPEPTQPEAIETKLNRSRKQENFKLFFILSVELHPRLLRKQKPH
jgi:hypothetical protein